MLSRFDHSRRVAKFVPFEFGSIKQDLMPMFEVNVLGLIRVTKGVLPFLRQSQGRIVNVGSMAGRMTFGSLTGYCVSVLAGSSYWMLFTLLLWLLSSAKDDQARGS